MAGGVGGLRKGRWGRFMKRRWRLSKWGGRVGC